MTINLVEKLKEMGANKIEIISKSDCERDIKLIGNLEVKEIGDNLRQIYTQEGFKIKELGKGSDGGNFVAKLNGSIYSLVYFKIENYIKITEIKFF